MTTAILRKKRKMDNLRKKFLRKNTEKNETAYEIIKGEYSNDIRLAKNKYFGEELYKAHKNSKKLWSTIHQIIHGKTRSQSIENIKVNDALITDNNKIAEVFSNFYKHVAFNKVKNINSNCNFEQFLSDKDMRKDTFKLKDVSLEDIWGVIKTIKPKCSTGIDNVPSKLVCKSANYLLLPMKVITNKCFSSGKFPDILKCSKFAPTHKKNDYIPENFRPICQQSPFSKIIEKLVQRQMIAHDKEQFDDRYQYAFRQKHSTSRFNTIS